VIVLVLEVVMDTEHPVPESGEKRLDLMDRATQLFQELKGPRWSEIAKTLQNEGYLEDGKALSSNALRKRFQKDPVLRKLLENARHGKPQRQTTPAPTGPPVKKPGPPVTRTRRDNTTDTTVTAKEVLEILQGSIQRRDEMLLEQIRKSNTMSDTRIIQEIEEEVKLMETRMSDIEERLEILVEDKVEENLKSMVTPGGSFERDLESLVTKIVQKRLSGEVGTLLSALSTAPAQGPGRWEGEGKMARFSATMPQHLYDQMKAIEGDASFSARIAAACDFYLRALAAQGNNTEYDKEG
jgi:hypothetical protein